MRVSNSTFPGVVIVQFLERPGSFDVQFRVAYVASVTLLQLAVKPRDTWLWPQEQFEAQLNTAGVSSS